MCTNIHIYLVSWLRERVINCFCIRKNKIYIYIYKIYLYKM